MDKAEIAKLQAFLCQRFSNGGIEVRSRPQKTDSCEVYLGDEFLGVMYLDDEDGDRSYMFQMAILDIDLDEVAD
jgi:uncharacterized protein DUF3126